MGIITSVCFGNLDLYDNTMRNITDLKDRVTQLERYNHLLIELSHNKSAELYENILYKTYTNDRLKLLESKLDKIECIHSIDNNTFEHI